MAEDDEGDMGRRLGQLAGLVLLGMIVSRAGRLVQFGEGHIQWHLIIIAAALLGGVMWWLMRQVDLNPGLAQLIFVLGAVIVFFRVAVPETLVYGVVPTSSTLPELRETMEEAFRLIRSGVAPVIPLPGLVALLATLMWVLGGLFAQGAATGRVGIMLVPAGAVYLQFAVFDRRPAGISWMIATSLVVGLALAGIVLDRGEGMGRARDRSGLPLPHSSPRTAFAMAAMVGVFAVMTTSNASGMVSEYGNLPWNSVGSGIGGSFGGNVVFDRWVDMRQRLISRNNIVLFRATLGPGAPPPEQIYWRMETLDAFDGVAWRRGNSQTRLATAGPLGDPAHLYRGSTATILQRVFISGLGGTILPTAGEPREIHSIGGEHTIEPGEIRFGRDGALFRAVGVAPDDNYQLETTFPLVEADLGRLATGPNGDLSPLFAAAAEEGLFNAEPGPPPGDTARPPDIQRYTELPTNTPGTLVAIALRHTRGATTDFEKAWLLQHWFRDSGDFTYSQEVSTGHGALVLDAWLNDSTSQNYRTGYCEQFAAAMAVLGRALGIPSRVVWGFTPGRVTTINGVEVIEVRDTNAHAWVEMWMDGFGWVRFDPTPRGEALPPSMTAGWEPAELIPEVEGPATPIGPGSDDLPITDIPPPGLTPGDGSTGGRSLDFDWWMAIPILGILIGAVPLAKKVRRNRRLARARSGDITALWDEIVDRLADLGEPVVETMTPIEWAHEKGSALMPLARGYAGAIYGGKQATLGQAEMMELEWWLQNRYDTRRRALAAINPKSLFRD
ncbi:MAG TPA: DUF3488 and transglutaminase-like domain-containing protein [Acidimicrobiia bacterium]